MQPTTRIKAISAIAIGLALLLAAPAPADAAPAKGTASPKAGNVQARKGKKKKGRRPVFSGHVVPASQLRAEPLPRPSGHLKLYNVNFRETLEVDLYNPDGTMNEDSLIALNHFWRCRRTGTEKPINPKAFELLSIVQDHFEGKTIEIVSGFRNQPKMTSWHFHGTATDFRVIGVSERVLHKYVSTLDTGHMGLGIYPHSHFIHVDIRNDASYRWTDYSGPGSDDRPAKSKKARKRNT